jgi:hypothetical protein
MLQTCQQVSPSTEPVTTTVVNFADYQCRRVIFYRLATTVYIHRLHARGFVIDILIERTIDNTLATHTNAAENPIARWWK